MAKLKVFEAFAGVGSQSMALRNIGVEYEVVGISEVDRYALLAYAAIHHGDEEVEEKTKEEMLEEIQRRNIAYNFSTGKSEIPKGIKDLKKLYDAHILSRNYGDICKIDTKDLPDFDIFTYSFPCKNISVAGKQASLEQGSGTQSALVWECEKIIRDKRPPMLLMENVKNLVGKRHKVHFDNWCEKVEDMGYNNYWAVLNGKDFGVPQNRERVMMVSILKENDGGFVMPEKRELTLRLKDMLEEVVPEKYYVSDAVASRFKYKPSGPKSTVSIVGTTAPEFRTIGQRDVVYDREGVISTLMASDYKQPKQLLEKAQRLGGLFDSEDRRRQAGSIWDKTCLSPTLDTMQGGYRQPLILEDEEQINSLKLVGGIANDKWVDDDGSHIREYPQGNRVYSEEGIACTQTAQGGGLGGHSGLYATTTNEEVYVLNDKETFKFNPNGSNVVGEMGGSLWDSRLDSNKRVYGIDSVAPSITTCQGGGTHPKILTEYVSTYVEVRKHEVDVEGLKKVLKEGKEAIGLSIKEIASKLNVDKTTAEHWFRSDKYFSIPTREIWLDLKGLLGIDTDKFDASIMEFEVKESSFDMASRVYRPEGVAPTLTAQGEGGAKKILVEYKGVDVELPCACASRGRNPENPSDRTTGMPTEQCIELNTKGVCNSLTTVQKDNYVLDADGTSLNPRFKIRKLMPIECWKLMGFTREDFFKAQEAGLSDTKLYERAGRGIVVPMLEDLFKSTFDCLVGIEVNYKESK